MDFSPDPANPGAMYQLHADSYYPPPAGQPTGYPAGYYRNAEGTQGYYQQKVHPSGFSLPRRLWRIAYPALIFLGVQLVISMVVAIPMVFSVVMRMVESSAAASYSPEAMTDELMQFFMDRILLVVLLSNVGNIAVFTPMWLRVRKQLGPPDKFNFIGAAFLTLGFFAGFNIVQMFIFSITDVMKYFPSSDDVSNFIIGGPFIIQVLSVGVIGPIAEELVFRGVILGRMKWLPNWAAVLISAAVFGFIHLNLFQGLYAGLAGVFLGLTFVKYRSIILACAGHIAYNLASVLMGQYMPEDSDVASLIALGIAAVTTVCCAIILIKMKVVKKQSQESEPALAEA